MLAAGRPAFDKLCRRHGDDESMTAEKNHNEVAFLLRLAGIPVPPERLPALAMGLGGLHAVADTLSKIEYGRTTPSFRTPVPVAR
jgi:hypothetical protein